MVEHRAGRRVCIFGQAGNKYYIDGIWLYFRYKIDVFSFDNKSNKDTTIEQKLHLIISSL